MFSAVIIWLIVLIVIKIRNKVKYKVKNKEAEKVRIETEKVKEAEKARIETEKAEKAEKAKKAKEAEDTIEKIKEYRLNELREKEEAKREAEDKRLVKITLEEKEKREIEEKTLGIDGYVNSLEVYECFEPNKEELTNEINDIVLKLNNINHLEKTEENRIIFKYYNLLIDKKRDYIDLFNNEELNFCKENFIIGTGLFIRDNFLDKSKRVRFYYDFANEYCDRFFRINFKKIINNKKIKFYDGISCFLNYEELHSLILDHFSIDKYFNYYWYWDKHSYEYKNYFYKYIDIDKEIVQFKNSIKIKIMEIINELRLILTNNYLNDTYKNNINDNDIESYYVPGKSNLWNFINVFFKEDNLLVYYFSNLVDKFFNINDIKYEIHIDFELLRYYFECCFNYIISEMKKIIEKDGIVNLTIDNCNILKDNKFLTDIKTFFIIPDKDFEKNRSCYDVVKYEDFYKNCIKSASNKNYFQNLLLYYYEITIKKCEDKITNEYIEDEPDYSKLQELKNELNELKNKKQELENNLLKDENNENKLSLHKRKMTKFEL